MNPFNEAVNRDWRRAETLRASGDVFEGTVSSYNSHGLVVRFGTLHGFLPLSQISSRPTNVSPATHQARPEAANWLSNFVDRTLQLKVIEADRVRRRLVFSQQ